MDTARRLTVVHQTACALLAALHRVADELGQGEVPSGQEGASRWSNINEAMAALRAIRNQLGACRGHLDLFRGLRPDGVDLCGIVCASWHQGVLHVGDGLYQLLRIRAGLEVDALGEYLWAPEEGDWTKDDLGLPNGGEWASRCRSRTELWNRAVALFRSENTLLGPYRAPDDEFHTSGWATLRELDFRSLPAQLAAEWRFASRQQIGPPAASESERPKLSDFQRKVLVALHASEVTSRSKRLKQRAIRKLVDGESGVDGRPFALLCKAELLDSVTGTEGGYWLTEAGSAEARRIAEEDAG